MKIKMKPLHGGFAIKGASFNNKITKPVCKESPMPTMNAPMNSAQKPMSKRSVKQ